MQLVLMKINITCKHCVMYIYIAFDTKLTEREVNELLRLIHNFSSKWEVIGSSLGFVPSELEYIRSMPLLLSSAPTSYLTELLRQWIQWPTQTHPAALPTLRAFCTALRSSLVGLGSLADEVEMEMQHVFNGKWAPCTQKLLLSNMQLT